MIDYTAKKFWGAAYFYRRAPDRDRSTAITVLTALSGSPPSLVQSRAARMMKEIEDDNRNPTSAS